MLRPMCPVAKIRYDDVIKWEYFPRYWPYVRGIHRSLVSSPHIGQWREALMFSLICAWLNGWVNNREAGDLRHHRAHYGATVMICEMVTRSPGALQQSRPFPRKFYSGLLNARHAGFTLWKSPSGVSRYQIFGYVAHTSPNNNTTGGKFMQKWLPPSKIFGKVKKCGSRCQWTIYMWLWS